MSNLIGKTLGQYQIRTILGKGGMATVYRATQSSMSRDVAIKIMGSELSENEEFIRRFEQEARFFATLQHPHILPVIDFGKSDDHIFIVMRLIEGGSLDERIRTGAIPLSLTVRMVSQIASALTFAHNKGVVHRDLKPNNVLLDQDNNCYLTDFGLAKMAQGTTRLTRTDAVMGTPSYMAPEQWTGNNADARTDIYAFGVMIYEMVTGQLPFEGDTSFVLMYKHMNEQPPSPLDHMEDLPQQVEDVVMKALAKRPEDRFQSADELAEALRNAAENRATTTKPIGAHSSDDTVVDAVPSQRVTPSNIRTEDKGGKLPDGPTMVGMGTSPKLIDKPTVVESREEIALPTKAAVTKPVPATASRRINPIVAIAAVVAVVIMGAIILLSRGGENDDTTNNTADSISLVSVASRIAFNRSTTESEDIYVMKADGSALRFIGTGGKPSWSFDDQYIAFDSSFTGDPELFLITTDGTNLRNLTNNPETQEYFASFSPDSLQFVFHSNRNGNFDIYSMNIDGSNLKQLTDNVANDQWPSWSPKGDQIAFTSQRDGNLEIYVMDADGSNLRRITEIPAADLWVAWSPDGTQIAFQSNRDGNLEIYVMNVDGTDVKRLTDNAADDQWPDWSSENYIVFSSNRDGNQEIYTIRPDGTGLTRITNSSTDERFPSLVKIKYF